MLSFLRLSLLALVLPLLVLADTHAARRANHRELARRATGDIHLYKRFSGSRWTFYDVGLGACGKYNVPGDFIVAMNSAQYGQGYPGPLCFKQIRMTYNGKSTTATVMDECPGCPYGGLDLSIGLFKYFASLDLGVLTGSWEFTDGSDSPPPKSDPKPAPKPKPSPPKEQPKPTPSPKPSSAPPPPKPSSSSAPASSSSSSSSTAPSSSAAARSVASSAPVPSSVPAQLQQLSQLNFAFVYLSQLVTAGAKQ